MTTYTCKDRQKRVSKIFIKLFQVAVNLEYNVSDNWIEKTRLSLKKLKLILKENRTTHSTRHLS